jgi:hypothetical protein
MSDDRFSEPNTFKYPDAPWDGVTPEDVFRKAFYTRNQDTEEIQRLRKIFPRLYEKVAEEFEGG